MKNFEKTDEIDVLKAFSLDIADTNKLTTMYLDFGLGCKIYFNYR